MRRAADPASFALAPPLVGPRAPLGLVLLLALAVAAAAAARLPHVLP